MTEVIDLSARRQGRQSPPDPAPLSDRLEGLMTWARHRIEDMVPMTRLQRMTLAVIFEQVLDQIDTLDGNSPQPGNSA